MRALILAAGEGTRLRPLTLERPKPMLPIGDRPLLEHLVNLLQQHGVREIAINLHYKPEAITQHFGDGSRFGVSITYSHEDRLVGSAGAARRLDWYFTEPFLVLYGDVLSNVNLTALVDAHHARDSMATLALYEVEDPTRCGIVELDSDGRILSFVEKPQPDAITSTLANAGIYVIDPSLLELVPRGESADFGQDIFPRALDFGLALHGVPLADSDYVLDIGSLERYRQAQEDVLTGRFRAHTKAQLVGATNQC